MARQGASSGGGIHFFQTKNKGRTLPCHSPQTPGTWLGSNFMIRHIFLAISVAYLGEGQPPSQLRSNPLLLTNPPPLWSAVQVTTSQLDSATPASDDNFRLEGDPLTAKTRGGGAVSWISLRESNFGFRSSAVVKTCTALGWTPPSPSTCVGLWGLLGLNLCCPIFRFLVATAAPSRPAATPAQRDAHPGALLQGGQSHDGLCWTAC